jgi:hypothetical protein
MVLLQVSKSILLASRPCNFHLQMEILPLKLAQAENRRPLSGKPDYVPPFHALPDIVTRMGELEPWIDENFVRNLWFQMGEQVSVKMIRDKFSG